MNSACFKSLWAFLLITALFTSCKKKNEEPPVYVIDAPTVSLHYDETHTFNVTQGATSVSGSSLTWTSSDVKVGTISASGLFTAKRVGKTNIKGVSGTNVVQAEITVTPYSTICKEPFFEFGATKASTKSKEFRVLFGETSEALGYTGENSKVRNVLYGYENSAMTSAAILFANTEAVVDEALQFFDERYQYIGQEEDFYVFTDNSKTSIGVTVDDNLGFMALYVPYTPTGSGIQQVKSAYYSKKPRLQAMKRLIDASQRVN